MESTTVAAMRFRLLVCMVRKEDGCHLLLLFGDVVCFNAEDDSLFLLAFIQAQGRLLLFLPCCGCREVLKRDADGGVSMYKCEYRAAVFIGSTTVELGDTKWKKKEEDCEESCLFVVCRIIAKCW